MRLKCVKLAGFKSFVDPTTVSFPNNLSAVVGPNGCGKSNVIDAVRWVMGESSAKHLRGESMTDVIFNGSNARKPTTQASVELVFDNSDNTIVGEYASYNEVAVKRIVTREAQSHYYLNSVKCRRKDITDIFLGTGLGPRSYAIIEQGMISRLIEAKPEDLRIFIEEAAGISKYKERRRETENRMKRTRENLDRLEDLREELGRQLQHLERQAASAEKYKEYKEEERLLKAQLQALRWKAVDLSVQDYETHIRDLEVKLEACIADQRAMDAEIEKHRDVHTEVNDKLNEVQGRYYGLGADIARIEQTIQHQKERGSQLRKDLQDTIEACKEAEEQLGLDQAQAEEYSAKLMELEPELEMIQAQSEESAEALATADESMQSWQHEWDEFNQSANEPRQKAQVEQSRIQHLEQSIERLRDRVERLDLEKDTLSAGPLEEEVADLEERVAEAEIQLEDKQATVSELLEKINTKREDNNRVGSELDTLKSDIQSLKGRHASLEALQQAALGESDVVDWLADNSLSCNKRLATEIKVQTGWEKAVETVLGDYLQAVCVDGFDAVSSVIGSLEHGSLAFVDQSANKTAEARSDLTPLAQYLDGNDAGNQTASQLIANVYAVETLADAMAIRDQLKAGESIVTQDGLWVGANWFRVAQEDNPQSGTLQRQQELQEIEVRLEETETKIEDLSEKLQEGRDGLREHEQGREQAQREVSEFNRANADIKAQLSAKQVRLEQFSMRRERISRELDECKEQQQQEQESIGEARLELQEALDLMEQDTAKREELLQQRDSNREALDQVRQKAREDKDKAHQVALEVRSMRAQSDSTKQGAERLSTQLKTLNERRASVEDQLSQGDDPFVELQAELEEKLENRLKVEDELNESRKKLEACEHELRGCEKKRSEAEQAAQGVRSELERNRMQWQGLQVQRTNLTDQLKADDFDLETVLENIPDEANEADWQAQLERLASRISRLGAINLAAIEEFKSQSERKNYLDAQHNDLIEALETLEGAIRKIDRETRTRFKETFDKVNSGLQELFPKVFGGGHAYLELTGDDLLDTGVAIMARPPGKRNSTIHLLSGGEKALTAIALVFSIFKLNPAPFCILDEVDAPLDDANVGRYSRMVQEMSDQVQFIYITHNKIAMEMAHQLMGVTMHEPGVSRVVSVDVEEAAAMAAL